MLVPGLAPESNTIAGIFTMLGLDAVVCAVPLFGAQASVPGVAVLLPTVGTAFAITGSTGNRRTLATRFLASRSMASIGRVSYSW